ncbi:hypothetical protein BCR36DRAFT_410149 [Piromyces finnis]|uniref:Surp module n=1 Tax=Piromyces finnis TaxID=1754191 RepID=A0A1Y1VHJ9_9FUNG|nr:hypothetical protein BCR36DRAFT_410149 [Piromyces finnis]|eukprot:ORX56120.1 hypothetical protein BCR36DRAFT_410149 [Piromyces finnis]
MSSVDSNTDVVGIIYPPPEIRNIIDKTASFVARNTVQFENLIKEKEKFNPKFSFLNPNDPYYSYYQFKIKESKDGKSSDDSKKLEEIENKEKEKKEKIPEKPIPKEPSAYEFMAELPAISAQDLDILKLTAQFVARNGRQFMTGLAQREQKNYQFEFLRPNHSLFNYFTKLVEQYTKVLIPSKKLFQNLDITMTDKYTVLDRALQRVEYKTYQEEQKKKEEEKADAEKIAYASIDWHDFVIVDTIEFTEADESMDLPPPMSLSELQHMSLVQKKANLVSTNEIENKKEEDQAGDMEMDEEMDVEDDSQKASSGLIHIDSNAPIKIRTDYKPKALKSQLEQQTQICPRCGQAIPISEMDEHVRIELLDPKWREQKKISEAKKKDSNLLQTGIDVAANLNKLSGYRTDIFGSEEVEIGKKIEEDAEKAKQAEKEKVIWDGHIASIGSATRQAQQGGMSIDEQIAAIYRRKGLADEDKSKIGPQMPEQKVAAPPSLPIVQPPGISSAPGLPIQPVTNSSVIPPRPNFPPPNPFLYQQQSQGIYPPGPAAIRPPNMQQMPSSRPPMMMHNNMPPALPLLNNNYATRPKDQNDMFMPDAKRQRTDSSVPPPPMGNNLPPPPPSTSAITVKIQTSVYNDKPEWGLDGQIFTVQDVQPNDTVSVLKERISQIRNMPAGRQKLSMSSNGTTILLKNSMTVTSYGINEGVILTLAVKERGGRK